MKLLSLFDGLYSITDDGRLYSHRHNKYLKPSTDKYGYLYYVISIRGDRRTLKAHRLVAQAFIPNDDNKPTVNHINGIRTDNRVSNLEWATYKEQQNNPITKEKVRIIHQQTDYRAMGACRNFGRVPVVAYKNGIQVGKYSSLKEASLNLGIMCSHISQVIHGHRKTAGGMTFEAL